MVRQLIDLEKFCPISKVNLLLIFITVRYLFNLNLIIYFI